MLITSVLTNDHAVTTFRNRVDTSLLHQDVAEHLQLAPIQVNFVLI